MKSESKKYIKYPRTKHLPWSKGASNDDINFKNDSVFKEMEVVVTEKLDGECITMYNDHIHARSIDSGHHPSREWVKNMWGTIAHKIPESQRICGENMFWVHSIIYTELPSYFLVFSWWEDDVCFSWDQTLRNCEALGLLTVPVLYRGPYDRKLIEDLWDDSKQTQMEGYVVRPAGSFKFSEFSSKVGKFVRPNHVQTDQHWMRSGGERNMLKVERRK